MTKEKLTLENISNDLMIVVRYNLLPQRNEWSRAYRIPGLLACVIIGCVIKAYLIAFLAFILVVFDIANFVMSCKKKPKKNFISGELGRDDISISVEKYSHTSTESVCESSVSRRRHARMKNIKYFHFKSGNSWRVPTISNHYNWSKNYSFSSKGLDNISIIDDEFFYICLQGYHDVAYIYPCKYFELDSSLMDNIKRD